MAAMEKTSTPGVYRKGTRYVVVWRHRGQQHKSSHRTYAEAREAKGRRAAGDRRPSSRVRFAEYAAGWLDSYGGRTSRGFSDTTRDEYRRAIEKRAIPFFGRFRMDEVEPQDVRRFLGHLDRTGVGPAAVRKSLAPLRAMFATALEDGVVRTNPARGVRFTPSRGAAKSTKPKAMKRSELATLLGAIPEEDRLLFEFLAHSGLRISEAIGLRWQDVEFGVPPRVLVRTQVYQGKRKELKSSYAARDIPLSPAMARKLWVLRGSGGDDQAPVFPTVRGTPYNPSNLRSRVLAPASKAAGLEWVSFHTFRHTCASLLFEAGKNPKQVQVWLGHHDAGFTLKTYVHLMDDGLGDAGFLDAAVCTHESEKGSAPSSGSVTSRAI